ncbi:hypothetical protein GCM10011613_07850 [Cellvibrio zantedeschiae]|uniref:LiaF transmembrane domain-containing protein n=1 Tax=Cellvibrio zantedeschiae TaxID=1237077 RepID=A0ABQ3ASY4_9GAMM|nr:DUF5668 domain-containing protein [Cellvibrio zantedeschiae]GGY66351.1 hypothetical protein GCM10011613_07850 [Cellvibrio zantedeschiae]
MSHQQLNQRIILGGFIIALGILALVDRLGIFSIGSIFQFWPTVFVVVGLLKIAASKSRSSIATGSIFIAIGVVMQLNNLGIIHFSWHDWWPVILIGVGISIIFKDHSRSKDSSKTILSDEELKNTNSVLDITAIMGGNETVNNSPDFKGGELTAIMGGVELDLRGASIQSEAVLNLWATWGGIALKIPADWVVVNRCTAIMGGIEDKSFASPATAKRLIITGTVIMGGVEIKN